MGFRFRELILNHLAYADDLVVITESPAELQKLISIFYAVLAEVDF